MVPRNRSLFSVLGALYPWRYYLSFLSMRRCANVTSSVPTLLTPLLLPCPCTAVPISYCVETKVRRKRGDMENQCPSTRCMYTHTAVKNREKSSGANERIIKPLHRVGIHTEYISGLVKTKRAGFFPSKLGWNRFSVVRACLDIHRVLQLRSTCHREHEEVFAKSTQVEDKSCNTGRRGVKKKTLLLISNTLN